MKKHLQIMMLLAALLVPWALQAQNTQTFNFEDQLMPAAFTNDATYPWTVVSPNNGQSGTYCIKSGNGGIGSSTSAITATFTFAGDGSIAFKGGCWGEGSTTPYDKCIFEIDGVAQFTYGALAAWSTYSYEIEAGVHTFTWKYSKDGTVNPTGDAFFVDDVVVDLGVASSCAKPLAVNVGTVTTNTITINWTDPTATAWQVFLYENDSVLVDGYPMAATDSTFTFVSLTANTLYNMGVAADCGEEISAIRFVTGRTACAAINEFPWTENFDSYTAGEFLVPCWVNERIVDGSGSGTLSIFKIVTSTQGGNTTPMLQLPDMPAGSRTKLVLPQMNFPNANYMFSIDVYRNATGTSHTVEGVRIFASTDGEITGATQIAFISRNHTVTDSSYIPAEAEAGWYTYELPIGINGNGYVIIQGESNYGQATYMDSFIVKEIPSCVKPRMVTVVDSLIGAYEATVTWVSDANNFQVEYKKTADSIWTVQTVSGASAVLSGLQPNTAYDFRMKAICSAQDESEYCKVIHFMTACVPLVAENLPYNYNFDDATGSGVAQSIDQCWGRYHQGGTSNYPSPSNSYSHSGSYSLYFSNTTTIVKNWATLPVLDASLSASTLSIGFWAYKTAAAGGRLKVGVMSDPENISTFYQVAQLQVSAVSTWEFFEFTLDSYIGDGKYVVILADTANTNAVYVDDVTLLSIPLCERPEGVTVTTLTQDYATITISDPSYVGSYRIQVSGDTTFSVDIQNTVYDILNLAPNGDYTVAVSAICSDGNPTTAVTTVFHTPCVPYPTDELPWTENFDSYTGSTSASASARFDIPCWRAINRTSVNNPFFFTSYNHSSPNSINFVSSATAVTTISLPLFEAPVNALQFSLQARIATSGNSVAVGYMSNPDDASTFVPVDTVAPTATSVWQEFVIHFPADAEGFIAIRRCNGNNVYLDDFSVTLRPACERILGFSVDSITFDGATVHIDDPTAENNYVINVINGEDTTEFRADDTVYTITELLSNTPYTIEVYTVCPDSSVTVPYNTNIRTACTPISELPWIDDFESHTAGAAPYCWYSVQGNNTVMNSESLAHSGSKRLDFRGNTAGNIVLFPDLGEEQDWNNVSVNFWTRPESTNASCGNFRVGYFMAREEENDTVFVTLDSISYADFTVVSYVNIEVSFADMPEGSRPAFFHLPNATNYYWYVDDVVLYNTPSCSRAQGLGIANLTNESVDVVVIDTNEQGGYYLLLSHDSIVEEYAFDNTVETISDLQPNTEYSMVLVTDCGGDTTWPITYTFKTYCDPIEEYPFVETFDSLTGGTSATATSRMDIPCWFFPYRSSDNYPYICSSATYNPHGGNCVYTNTSTVIALPYFSNPPAELMVEFDAYVGTANWGFEVGYITDASKANTFVPVTTCIPSATSRWQHFTCTFAGVTEGLIAFRTVGTTAYLDSIVVSELPSCVAPTTVSFSGIDSVSATVNIVDANNANHYSMKVGTDVYEVNGNSFLLSDLTPNTEYPIVVRTYCYDGSLSEDSTVATLRTQCGVISLPFFENFNNLTSSYNSNNDGMIPCWDINKSAMTSILTAVTSGTYLWDVASLKFDPKVANSRTIIVLPRFDMPISELELAFQTRPEGNTASAGSFDVGYMTDASVDTTFVVVEHYNWDEFGGAYHMKVVHFADAPENARIAMRHNANAYNYFWFVDDVNVYEAPSCFAPQGVSVDNITTTDATIHVVDSNEHLNYLCVFDNDVSVDTIPIVNDSVITVTTLQPSTSYTLRVMSLCEDGTTTTYVQTEFNTLCGPISLPAFFDPNNYATGATNIPYCWARNANGTSYNNYPYIYGSATNAHTGTNVLYYYFTSTSGYPSEEIMALPEIDTVNFPMNQVDVTFWAKSSPAGRHFVVGVMSNPSDATTFQAVDTISLTAASAMYTVELGTFAGTGSRVALKAYKDTTATTYIYVDDISLAVGSPCPRSRNLTATGATDTSIVLGWTDVVSGYTQWKVRYTYDTLGPWTEVTVNSNPCTLTGLTHSTKYAYQVAPICEDGQTAFYSREICRFNTTQIPVTVPYSYDFEDPAEWNNWQTASNNNVNWYRGNVAQHDTSYAMYLSADSGATHSWNMNVVTNAVAYRDVDFGPTVGSYQVEYDAYIGGTIAQNYDGIAVVVVDPSIYVECPNTGLHSPWGPSSISLRTVRRDTNWSHYVANIDGVSGVKRLAFYHFNQATGATSAYMNNPSAIDNVSIVAQECVRPYDLNYVSVTDNSVSLHWEGADTATYVVDYRPVGTTGTDLFDTVVGISHTVTGLTSLTSYNFWVKKMCDDSTYSAWTSNITVTTLCGYETLPFLEDFESYTGSTYNSAGILPECWAGYANGTSDVYTPHITGSGSYSYPHSGTKVLTMTSGTNTTYGNNKVVAMPPFAEPLSSLKVSFWYRMESATQGILTVGYVTNLNDLSGSFVPVKTVTNVMNTSAQDSVTFDNVPAVTAQIAFRWSCTTGTYYTVGIDDISVTEIAVEPVCDAPDTLVVSNIAYHTADIAWDGDATSYEVAIMLGEWVEPVIGDTIIDTDSISFADLTPNTPYAFGVRSVCDEGLVSDWNVTYFSTAVLPCFTPENLRVSDENYTSAIVTFTPGLQQSRWQLHLFRQGFDRYEYVTDSTYTFEGLTYNQSYQVAVRAICGANDTSDWSDTVLFSTLNCNTVTGVNVDQIMATTAHVTWESTGAASYIVAYGYQGFNQGEGTEVPTENNYYTIEGLEPNTMYDVMVSAVCTDGVSSLWSARFTFSTQAGTGTYYTISVYSNNTAWGTVSGGGTYEAGSVRQITATPTSDQYRFVKWDDENTDNPRTITVNADATYTALFAENVGIEEAEMSEVSLFPNPATSTVSIRANGMEQVTLIDLNGSIVMTQRVSDETVTFDVSNLAKGAYFVRITGGNGTAVRKLIVK